MGVVNHRERWAWANVPKIASQTLHHALVEDFGGTRVENSVIRGLDDGYLRFVVCRNPYDRAVSLWYSTCVGLWEEDRYGFRKYGKTVKDLVRNIRTGRMVASSLAESQGAAVRFEPDIVLRFENLDEDFRDRLPFVPEGYELPHRNVTSDSPHYQAPPDGKPPRRPYMDYMDGETIREINLWVPGDFERFNYPMM